jgi:hypothetical protein
MGMAAHQRRRTCSISAASTLWSAIWKGSVEINAADERMLKNSVHYYCFVVDMASLKAA